MAGVAIVVQLAALVLLGSIAAGFAAAASAAPHWSISSESQPTNFQAGAKADAYVLIVRNDGAAPTTHGAMVSVSDTLPAGVIATTVNAEGEGADGAGTPTYTLNCPTGPASGTITCTYVEGSSEGAVLPGAVIVMTVTVSIPEGVGALGANTATVSGGGAPSATTSTTTAVSSAVAPFGMSSLSVDAVGEGGEADTQAGSHPFELTAGLSFTVAAREARSEANAGREAPLAAAAPKDLEVSLPPGLVGNPQAVPRCSQQAFLERESLNCPLDSQVGTIKPFFYGTLHSAVFPVYDVVAPPGQPLELGFSVGVGHVPLFLRVRTDGDYGLTGALEDIPESGPLQGAILTLWGVPAASSHDLEREGTVGFGDVEHGEFCQPSVAVSEGLEQRTPCPSGAGARPFLTLPGDCTPGGLSVGATTDSWQEPGQFRATPDAAALGAALSGCERLSFAPTLTVTPETTEAGAPSGYELDVRLPQAEAPGALATPDLRSATVALPAGVVVSPAAANGLQACAPSQFQLHSAAPAACPPGSRIGAVTIATPLLPSPLEGSLFLGEPRCAPCAPADAQEGRLLALLVQAQAAGVTVKLEGSASIDQATGQLTASFRESPQLPFEDVRITLDGGANALLANTSGCGTPLSARAQIFSYAGEAPAEPTSAPFSLGGCAAPAFSPSLLAGTVENRAGAFSALTITLSRGEEEEAVRSLSVRLAPGLLAMLARVPLCTQAQAQALSCPGQSRIGTASAVVGPGPAPLSLDGGVYLTGPYEGAPFGLSIVVPASAGPFDLGELALAARVTVDPATAALTIATDPLPQSIDGIPLQLRAVNLDIDREGFVFNATSCRVQSVEGESQSVTGANAASSTRYQAAGCAQLAFRPRLGALTHAHAGPKGGAYLHVRILATAGQANIAALALQLPHALVPRLSTLQGACPLARFDADPTSCPSSALVGGASVLTPVLRTPLRGAVYAISQGRAQTPTVGLALQGEGVAIDVIGQTSSRRGAVSASFRDLPDVPFSELDIRLAAGPHSLLASDLPAKAHGSMCGRRLAMPTTITAQDGAIVRQTTIVAVSGCRRR